MNIEKETIIANKYHFDTGLRFVDWSDAAIKLCKGERKNGKNYDKEWIFIPKSLCIIFIDKDTGKVTIMIDKWFYDKEETKLFMRI